MLQRLIHNARVNVFESARFYYWMLMVLTFHLIARHSLIKILLVNGEAEWLASKAITGLFYTVVYGACLFSAVLLRKKISFVFLNSWIVIFLLSLISEVIFVFESDQYNFIESFTEGKGLTNVRITLPLIFLGVFKTLDNSFVFSRKFLNLIQTIFFINSFLIITGVLFEITVFESYPNSSRWGYSGVLNRGACVVIYTVLLIETFRGHIMWIKPALLFLSLIFVGTKASILSLFLFVFLVVIKSFKIRAWLLCSGVIILLIFPKTMFNILITSPFLMQVYLDHGGWGLLFSLRNELFVDFVDVVCNDYTFFDLFFGGRIHGENFRVEMLPVDLFIFYGVTGLITFLTFYLKWLKSWASTIPLLVAFGSGSLTVSALTFIVWGVWVNKFDSTSRNF